MANGHNGIIVEYNVTLIEIDSFNVMLYTTTTTELNVSSLLPYTWYKFAVSASTSVGTGPISNYTTFITLQDCKILN